MRAVALAEELADLRHNGHPWRTRTYAERAACGRKWSELEAVLRDCDEETAQRARAAGARRTMAWSEFWNARIAEQAKREGWM